MRKVITRVVLLLAILNFTIPHQTYAATFEDVAATSENLHIEGSDIVGGGSEYGDFWRIMREAFNDYLRYCDPTELGYLHYSGGFNTWHVSRQNLERIEARNSEAVDYARELAHEWKSETDGLELLEYCDFVARKMRDKFDVYDCEAPELWDYQGAWALARYNRGCCATYTRMFRAIIEATPFADGRVDFENGTECQRVSVFLDFFNQHSWNGIKLNGDYLYYDVVFFKVKKSDRYIRASLNDLISDGFHSSVNLEIYD